MGRLLRHFGIKKLNLVFPVSGVMTYVALLAFFSFPAALMGSFVREVLLPAVRRPTRNLFFNALPDYIQGRARAVAVSLVLPVALALASVVLLVLGESAHQFLIVGLVANLIYLFYAFRMNKAYVTELVAKLRDRLYLPEDTLDSVMTNCSEELLRELERGINHDDDALAFGYAKLLLASDGARFVRTIIPRIEHATPSYQDRMIKLLASHDLDIATEYCRSHLEVAKDVHIKATMLKVLIDSECPSMIARSEELLEDDSPRLVAMGILGVHRYGIERLQELALQKWRQMFVEGGERSISAIELLAPIPEKQFYPELLENVRSGDVRRQQLSLDVVKTWPHEHASEQLQTALAIAFKSTSPGVRARVVQCYGLLPSEQQDSLFMDALEDPHMDVRKTAIEYMDDGTDDFDTMLCAWVIGNAGSPRAQRAILTYLGQSQIPSTVLWEIILAKADDAEMISDALHVVEGLIEKNGNSDHLRLLKVTLEERKKQVLNLALQTLERVESRDDIRVISAAVNGKDSRDFANAVEALSHIKNKALATKLLNLFEALPAERDSPIGEGKFESLEDILGLCAGRPDPWLRECVAYVKTNQPAGVTGYV